MRTIVPLLLALVGMSLTSTYADAGAWCATYRRGVSNCGYSSFEQCWATVLGLGGFCRPNPFPGTAYGRLAEALSAQLLAKSHAPQRAHDPTIRPLCKMALWSPDQARGDAHGMELKRSRNRLRIFAGASRHSWSADVERSSTADPDCGWRYRGRGGGACA